MHFKYRIVNFLIDTAVFLVFSMVFLLIFRKIVDPTLARNILIAIYFIYYFSLEAVYGKTVGKMFTKTLVVDKITNKRPKVYQIMIRTMLRGLPFYFLSYFISEKGLHDNISQTILIKS